MTKMCDAIGYKVIGDIYICGGIPVFPLSCVQTSTAEINYFFG